MGDAKADGKGSQAPSPSQTPAPQQKSKGDGVTVEGLFERYRDDTGIPLDSFLKFFRDALLFHNAWTYGQAATCFFEMASHQPDGQGGSEPVLLLENFRKACKRYTRQSALVADVAATMGRPPDGVSQDAIDEWRWTGFTAMVGTNLQPEPRSKDDMLLNNWLLSTPIQMAVLESEYAIRRVYRRLCNAPTWYELEIDPQRKVSKMELSRMLRELIPRDKGGPLRPDDLSNAVRTGNHENTSREPGWRDTSSGDATFPEFLEMTLRCTLGTSSITIQDKDPGDPDYSRGFEPSTDGVAYAVERLKVVLTVLEEWYLLDLERENAKGSVDNKLSMDDSPIYDNAYTDVQMVFAHYCTGDAYSSALDYTNPNLRLSGTGVFRLCRDAGFMDQRVNLTVVRDAYVRAVGGGVAWWASSLNYDSLKRLLVSLAKLKYVDCRGIVAINLMVQKYLVPMAYMEVAENEVSAFVFQERNLKLLLLYEKHVEKMLNRFTTSREITMDETGSEIISHEGAHEGEEGGRRKGRRETPSWLTERAAGGANVRTVKVVTLIDITSFLRCLNILPDLIMTDEVPLVFNSIVNCVPSQQIPINDASMCVSQVMMTLIHAAFLGFSRPPYAAKYATQTGKVLSMFGRVEIAYHNIFNKFIPLETPDSFPSQHLSLLGLTLEGGLRDFLFQRRIERGMPLVSLDNKNSHPRLLEDEPFSDAERKGHRVYEAAPERSDGRRPASLGIPNLIRDMIFAPVAPHPVGALMETALIHHNTQRFKAATETYLLAINTWGAVIEKARGEESNSLLTPSEEGRSVDGDGDSQASSPTGKQPAQDDWSQGAPPALLLYFFVALGGVYESAGLEELALACYSEGRIVGDLLEGAPESALAYSCIGSVLFHMGQPSVALTFIQRARDIREASLGELHMDTGLLYNNMGACFEMLDRVTEAIESFQRARDVFAYEHGLSHPRTATVMRNLARVKNRRFDFKVVWEVRKPTPCPPSLVGNDGAKKKKKGGKKGAKGAKKKK